MDRVRHARASLATLAPAAPGAGDRVGDNSRVGRAADATFLFVSVSLHLTEFRRAEAGSCNWGPFGLRERACRRLSASRQGLRPSFGGVGAFRRTKRASNRRQNSMLHFEHGYRKSAQSSCSARAPLSAAWRTAQRLRAKAQRRPKAGLTQGASQRPAIRSAPHHAPAGGRFAIAAAPRHLGRDRRLLPRCSGADYGCYEPDTWLLRIGWREYHPLLDPHDAPS